MYEFSNRALASKPSAIREIIKNMNDPTMISFAGGNPAVECFPIPEIKKYSDKILSEYPVKMLLYSTTEGVPSLRQSALAFANRYGRICTEPGRYRHPHRQPASHGFHRPHVLQRGGYGGG